MTTTLIKRVDGVELWKTQTGSAEQFAVSSGARRMRVVESLARAEALLAAAIRRARAARAH